MKIYLRPLVEEDALISYKWRNNPKIWEFTGNKPDRIITPEIEQKWIKKVLKRKYEKRYAICIESSDKYIGNVQLTNIKNKTAEFHIFIGEEKNWGKKIGYQATLKMIEIGFENLGLKKIFLKVNRNHILAIKLYLNCGFIVQNCNDNIITMAVGKNKNSF